MPKICSKLLSKRLCPRMGELVQANQLAFIKGRNLHDNFVLVRQVARSLHRRKAKRVMLKLDISRAFNTIAWPFLFEVLRAKGFPDLWLPWIATLLTTASSRVVVNGYAGPKFMHAQGLKQGDPISPLLFVIAMDALARVLSDLPAPCDCIRKHHQRLLLPLRPQVRARSPSTVGIELIPYLRPPPSTSTIHPPYSS